MKGLSVLFAVIAAVAANQCPQEYDVEKLLSHADCDKFYKCTFGQPVEQMCPIGLYFNLDLEQCDWPQNVECKERNVPVAKIMSTEGNQCPQEYDIEKLLSHADCDKFYKCTFGQPVEQMCPIGLYYNLDLEQCDWPQNVECKERNVPVAKIMSTEGNQCPQEYDIEKLLSHADCDKFYKCTFGQPVEQMCPIGLYFNLDLEQCDWPQNVECKERNVPVAKIMSTEGNQCPQEYDIEKLLSHADCDKFYKCTFGQPVEQMCPIGLYFNLDLEQCDWPQNVECKERNVPVAKIMSTEGNQCPQEYDIEKLLSHADCDKFYKCTFGQPVEQMCPIGLYFNLDLEQCDWPQNVECKERNVPVAKMMRPGGSQCPQEYDIEKLLSHADCDKFYKCTFGQPVEQMCPIGLYFNLDLEQCDWPQNVECKERNVPVAKMMRPGGSQCPQEYDIEKLLSHADCDKFYKCTFGQPVEQMCPIGLYFNLDLEQCDWPQNVECKERNVPVAKMMRPGGSQCPQEYDIEKLLSHADCDKFYKCTFGQPVEQMCPIGLYFNLDLEQCDWPQNVECKERNVPVAKMCDAQNSAAAAVAGGCARAVSANKHLPGRRALRQHV